MTNNILGNMRILDANVNRASEGIRVVEDIVRFSFENTNLTSELRQVRHKLRKAFIKLDTDFINSRDSVHDIGRGISAGSKLDKKSSLKQIINANFKRATEAFRVMEEISKLIDYSLSKEIENLRYQAYYLEKEVNLCLDDYLNLSSKKLIPNGLYGITCERFSNGKSNIQCVKEMIDAGIKVIQYREKDKEFREKIEESKEIAKLCKKSNVIFIVNDHLDIALLVDADGLHIGQEDMKISDARKILGNNKIIGISTHSPEQAEKAVADGADYIGVGPIFPTTTKDTAPVGFDYLEYAVKNVKIPFVAIGGIKEHNMHEIIDRGAKTICLVSDIVGAENIKEKVEKLDGKFI